MIRAHQRIADSPHDEFLAQLAREETPEALAMFRLAAVHGGKAAVALRSCEALAGGRLFPHPADLPPLITLLFDRLASLWQSCTKPEDDLYVAVFAAYGVLAIHPFDNTNGRVAIDFARYLLMRRWRLRMVPFKVAPNAHRAVGQVFRPLDHDVEATVEGFWDLRRSLTERFGSIDLATLRQIPAFSLVAQWISNNLAWPNARVGESQCQMTI